MERMLSVIREYYPVFVDFRSGQRSRRALALLPTGGGKSLLYEAPAIEERSSLIFYRLGVPL